jgi:hypothetical protein
MNSSDNAACRAQERPDRLDALGHSEVGVSMGLLKAKFFFGAKKSWYTS